jgi:hypothetical protein
MGVSLGGYLASTRSGDGLAPIAVVVGTQLLAFLIIAAASF